MGPRLHEGGAPRVPPERGVVVQLVRTPACQAGGRGFEPRRPRHSFARSPGPMTKRVASERLHGGAVLRLVLDAPQGNILDIAMMEALSAAIEAVSGEPHLKAVIFEGAGRHFSYGASIQEHRPERVGAMLAAFHGLFRRLAGLD